MIARSIVWMALLSALPALTAAEPPRKGTLPPQKATTSPQTDAPRTAAGDYQGTPFADETKAPGPQQVPGIVRCAWYDRGGEGVAYHDSDSRNRGQGALKLPGHRYLNRFRAHEGVDVSYTTYQNELDDSAYQSLQPPEDVLYVGWTQPGEWFNVTIEAKTAGRYTFDLLYTSRQGGTIGLDRDGAPLTDPIEIPSTFDDRDPVAARQWHHWSLLKHAASFELPAGPSVLTIRILTEGNMSLATLDFRLLRSAAD